VTGWLLRDWLAGWRCVTGKSAVALQVSWQHNLAFVIIHEVHRCS
jgi:hypothetical protein